MPCLVELEKGRRQIEGGEGGDGNRYIPSSSSSSHICVCKGGNAESVPSRLLLTCSRWMQFWGTASTHSHKHILGVTEWACNQWKKKKKKGRGGRRSNGVHTYDHGSRRGWRREEEETTPLEKTLLMYFRTSGASSFLFSSFLIRLFGGTRTKTSAHYRALSPKDYQSGKIFGRRRKQHVQEFLGSPSADHKRRHGTYSKCSTSPRIRACLIISSDCLSFVTCVAFYFCEGPARSDSSILFGFVVSFLWRAWSASNRRTSSRSLHLPLFPFDGLLITALSFFSKMSRRHKM